MNKVIRIDQLHVVLEEGRTQHSGVYGEVPRSYVVIQFSEVSGDCRYHYAHAKGGSIPHAMDMLPGGSLYLGETWEAAMKTLGVVGGTEGEPVP